MQRRRGGSLGEVRKELRPWLSPDALRAGAARPEFAFPAISPTTRDLLLVRARFEQTIPINGRHPYLENERGIPPAVLSDSRFADCVRSDQRGNAIFPHGNESEITGFEIKNHGFTGFSPGGEKGLWCSNEAEHDNALVIAESAIDALSHFAIRRSSIARYVSIAGALNKSQPELIGRAVGRMKAGSTVVIAVDNDEGGDKLLSAIRECLRAVPASIVEDRPETRGLDWNDVLRENGSCR